MIHRARVTMTFTTDVELLTDDPNQVTHLTKAAALDELKSLARDNHLRESMFRFKVTTPKKKGGDA